MALGQECLSPKAGQGKAGQWSLQVIMVSNRAKGKSGENCLLLPPLSITLSQPL